MKKYRTLLLIFVMAISMIHTTGIFDDTYSSDEMISLEGLVGDGQFIEITNEEIEPEDTFDVLMSTSEEEWKQGESVNVTLGYPNSGISDESFEVFTNYYVTSSAGSLWYDLGEQLLVSGGYYSLAQDDDDYLSMLSVSDREYAWHATGNMIEFDYQGFVQANGSDAVFDVPGGGDYYPDSASWADWDGDGDIDGLGWWKHSGESWTVKFLNEGNATHYNFTEIRALSTDPAFGNIEAQYDNTPSIQGVDWDFADFDGDGDYDILAVVYMFPESPGWYHENTGTSTSPVYAAADDTIFPAVPDSQNKYCGVELQDLDADGDMDLIYGSNKRLYYYTNNGSIGNPSWEEPVSIFRTTTGSEYIFPSSYVVDIYLSDADGDLDLDAYVKNGGGVYYFENIGYLDAAYFLYRGYKDLATYYYMTYDMMDIDGDGEEDAMWFGTVDISKLRYSTNAFGITGAKADYYFTIPMQKQSNISIIAMDYVHTWIGYNSTWNTYESSEYTLDGIVNSSHIFVGDQVFAYLSFSYEINSTLHLVRTRELSFRGPDNQYDVVDQVEDAVEVTAYEGDIFAFQVSLEQIIGVSVADTGMYRLDRRYLGNEVYESSLKVEVPGYGINATIEMPEYQEFVRFEGLACDYEIDSSYNTIILYNTVPQTYDLRFYSGIDYGHNYDWTPDYHAVYDVTAVDMLNIGFESGWVEDWTVTSSDVWTVDLATDVVFEGSRSLSLTSPSSISTYCRIDNSPYAIHPGEYYFTFAYFRYTSGVIQFNFRDNGTWYGDALNTTTGRWFKYFAKFEIGENDSNNANLGFYTTATDQHILIDDFRIWKANGQVRTTGYFNGYMETGMFATMRSIDLFDNPIVPTHPVTVEIRDRSADVTMFTYDTVSGTDGRIYVAIVLPYANQFNPEEYTFRITSLRTSAETDSYYTPIKANYYDYFMEENSTNYGEGGIDFSEGTSEGLTYTDCSPYADPWDMPVRNGYKLVRPDVPVLDYRIHLDNLNDINSSKYNKLTIVVASSEDDTSVVPIDQDGNAIGALVVMPLSTGLNDWTTITWDLSLDSDWTGIESGIGLVFDHWPVGVPPFNPELSDEVLIDQIWLYYEDDPSLISTPTYLYMTSYSGQNVYYVTVDGQPQDYIFDYDPFTLELSDGNHTVEVIQFLDLSRRDLCFIPADTQTYNYSISETGTMKIVFHDQSGYLLPFDQFKTYIDGIQLYAEFVFFYNISLVFNLTVTDIFDNIIFQDLTADFEYFKEIQITLYSIKIQNQQEFPIWIQLKRGLKTYSEAVFPFEIVEFKLETDTYDVRVNYTSVDANQQVVYNGTSVTYQYTVTKDTAIFITGTTIHDVFNNVVQVAQDIDNVNASLSSQIVDVDIHISNVNTTITDQVVSVEIFLDNVNTTLGSQLIDISTQISNLNTNISLQVISLNASIINMNSTIYSQTVDILTNITNMNTTLYDQTITVLSDISNVNSTLYSQTVSILTDILNVNSTLFDQGIEILTNITYIDSNINNTRNEIITAINYLNSTLWNQTMLHTVHFALADQAGIGLPWETFRVYINETRQYDTFIDDILNGTVLSIEATDYYGTSLYTGDHTITNETEIAIFVLVYWVYMKNEGDYPALVTLERNGIDSPEITVPVDSMISMRVSSGSYKITVRYQETFPEQDASERQLNQNIPKKVAYEGTVKVSARLPTILDVSTPDFPLEELVEEEYLNTAFVLFVIGIVIGATISYAITNLILRPMVGRHVRDRAYVGTSEKPREDFLDKLRNFFSPKKQY